VFSKLIFVFIQRIENENKRLFEIYETRLLSEEIPHKLQISNDANEVTTNKSSKVDRIQENKETQENDDLLSTRDKSLPMSRNLQMKQKIEVSPRKEYNEQEQQDKLLEESRKKFEKLQKIKWSDSDEKHIRSNNKPLQPKIQRSSRPSRYELCCFCSYYK
jgi:hypothetical protein